MKDKINGGKAWVFGDDIDTDQLAPGRFMKASISELASHCLEGINEKFATNVKTGDVLVAGKNFGIIDVNGDVYPCPTLVDTGKPLNGLKNGMAKAFENASDHNCKTCHIPCQNEFNLMYSLDPSTIFNIIRNYKFKG